MSALVSRTNFLNRAWLASFLLMLALLLTNGFIAYHSVEKLIENEKKVHRTLSTLNAIKDTFSAIQDADTGERGFLISGDEAYLAPYYAALNDIDLHLNHLVQLDSDIETQRPRIFTLTQLAQAKLGKMEKTIDLYQQHRRDDALKLFLTNE